MITVARRALRECDDGSAVLEVSIAPQDVVTVLRMAPIGAPLCLSIDNHAQKPPPITIAPQGASAGAVGAGGAEGLRQLRALAGDPLFQLYATERTSTDPATVPDAMVMALRFAVAQCEAAGPDDFERGPVLQRLAALAGAFAAWRTAREG